MTANEKPAGETCASPRHGSRETLKNYDEAWKHSRATRTCMFQQKAAALLAQANQKLVDALSLLSK